MKFSVKRDFCVWLVPPHDGKVRKYRFTFFRGLCVSAFLALVVGVFLFIAGDYTRVQLLRAKHYFSLQSLTKERDRLINQNEALESEATALKSMSSKVLSYQKGVKQRLEELASVVESATSLDFLTPEKHNSALDLKAGNEEGVGGAEIDCEGEPGSVCSPYPPMLVDTELASSLPSDPVLPYDSRTDSNLDTRSASELLEILDRYIDVLKIIPLGIPGPGHINSPFGYRRSPFGRGIRLHEGVDISLAHGSHIVSTGDGVVIEVGKTSTYGLMVDVAHSRRVVTRYAHLSRAYVAEGEKVCRGEVIGLVGSTGHSTGPHLHYEVRVDGNAKNPVPYLSLASKLKGLL